MHSDYYYLPEVFEKEKSYIIQNSWLLAGHTNELKNNFDFLTIDFLGEKIFIQNFNGTIRAFRNICLHRFNRIHDEYYGNRPPVCHYHNWSYNVQGKPSGIPNKAAFEPTAVENLCLKEYELGFCGSFVFVKLSASYNVNLQEYLGAYFHELAELSSHFGNKVNDFMQPHACNWKLAVENVLECYHCRSVHKESFAKMGYGFFPPVDIKMHQASSSCRFPRAEPEKKNAIYEKVAKACTIQDKGYLHYYIFPNTFISSAEGILFYLGNLIPETSTTSNLRGRNFAGTFSTESQKLDNVISYMVGEAASFSTVILNEDRMVLEAIQRNITAVKREPVLGDEEVRIRGFQAFMAQQVYN